MSATNSKFLPIWDLISKYKLFDGIASGNTELNCVICKNVMIDSVLNNVCGCHYCYKCINEYITNESKYCPGVEEDCKDHFISFGINLIRNDMLNKKISKLKVNCPNQSCATNIELSELEQHMGVCVKQPIECPFVIVGCNSEKANRDTIFDHLRSEIFPHSELLIELLQNLKNEINVLKDDFAKSKLEVVSLKDELLQVRNGIEAQVKEETEIIKKSMESHKYEIDCLGKEFKDCIEKNILKIVSLEEDSMTKENKILSLEEQLREMRMEMKEKVVEERNERNREIGEQSRQMENARIDRENLATMVNELRKNIDGMTEDRKKYDEDRDRQMNNLLSLCPNINIDFAWRIDQCSKKMDTFMFSESFYSNNYKLCLRLWLCKDDNIYLWCYIMKGDYDDMVEWPMRRAVTLSIVDKVTMTAYKSQTFTTSFNKPKEDRSARLGTYSFIKYSSIKVVSSIIANDSIVVSCVVSDP